MKRKSRAEPGFVIADWLFAGPSQGFGSGFGASERLLR